MSGTVIFRPRFSLQLKGMVIKMKLRAKKFLALILCVALTIFSSANVLADEKSTNSNQQQIGITAKSDAFPNAYIEVENGTTVAARDGTVQLQNATVTVYYEQTYGKDAEGNTIITDSRLLTEEEVNAIGKENFETGMPSLTREVSNEKGKLQIRMDGSYSLSGNSLSSFFSAMGNWSGAGLPASDYPAAGDDVAGFSWGGNLSSSNFSARGEYNDNSSATVTYGTGSPNAARAWYFSETSGLKHIKNVYFNIELSKANLTGGGNTTSLIFTYIHTFSTFDASANISANGAGITISGASSWWPLSVELYGIPY